MPPAELVLLVLYLLLLLWPLASLADWTRQPTFAAGYALTALITTAALLALGLMRLPLLPAMAVLAWWEMRAVRGITGPPADPPAPRVRILAVAFVLPLVAAAIALPAWLLPRVPPAVLTGPFPVGATDQVWTDSSRTDASGQPRRLPIRLWLPAEAAPDPGVTPRHPDPDQLERDLVAALPGSHGPWIVRALTRAADPVAANARLSTRQRQFPVLILDHGLPGAPALLAGLAAELASHGYLVVAPAHPGWTLGTAPSPEPPIVWGEEPAREAAALTDWLADGRFVLDQIRRMAGTDAPPTDLRLAGRLLVERIAWVGQGIGGLAGATLAADSGLAALVWLDPPDGFEQAPRSVPELVVTGSQVPGTDAGRQAVTLPGAGPADFTDLARWSPVLLRRHGLGGRVGAAEASERIRSAVVAFLSEHIMQ